MSGVYIYEAVPRDRLKKSILKIGVSRGVIEKRIEECFNSMFRKDEYSYFIIDMIPCNVSLAVNLENYLINILREKTNLSNLKGAREWFFLDEDISHYLANLDDYILDFYRGAASMHSAMESSIGCIIRSKRKKLRLSQTDLGDAIGMRQATISELENGKIGNYSTLKRITDHLDISILFTP